jgi:hypothetical protein
MFGPSTKVLKIPVPPCAKFIPYCSSDEFLNAYGVGDFIFKKEAAYILHNININY